MTLKRDQPMVSQGTVFEKGKVRKYLVFRMLHFTLINIRKPKQQQSGFPEVFSGKSVLKICSKFTG